MTGDVEIRCTAPMAATKAGKCGSFLGKFNSLGLVLKCSDRKCKGFTVVNRVKGRWVLAHITNPETIKALRQKIKKES
jgi:hypothetical protein